MAPAGVFFVNLPKLKSGKAFWGFGVLGFSFTLPCLAPYGNDRSRRK